MPSTHSHSHYTTMAQRLADITSIVRRANSRVSHLAYSVRRSLAPTHHAKARATKLKLTVSIEKALKLDQKQVSVIPLPVLVLETPPPPPFLELAPATAPAPAPVQEISRAVVGREREIRRLSRPCPCPRPRPALRCDIPSDIVPGEDSALSSVSVYSNVSEPAAAPVVLRGQNVPWRPVTSRWSMTTIDPSDAEDQAELEVEPSAEVEVEDQVEAEDQEAEVEVQADEDEIIEVPRYSYTSEYHAGGSLDLPITVSPCSPFSSSSPYGDLEPAQRPAHGPAQAWYPLGADRDTRRVERAPQHLVVPLRMGVERQTESSSSSSSRRSWGSSSSSGSSSGSSSSGFSSSGSSSSSGSTSASSESSSSSTSTEDLETPATSQPKLMIRIKRSIPADLHIADALAFEKRPKYGRKPWAVPATSTSRRTMTMTTRSHATSNRF